MAGLTRHLGVLHRLLSLATPLRSAPAWTRRYGAAAAYDYHYYDSEDDESDLRGGRGKGMLPTMADGEGSKIGRGVQWVVIGEPGAKKHVYAKRLSKLLQVPHISLGNLVLQELNPHSSIYKEIENSVNQGKLVPEDIILGMLSKRLEEGCSRDENGFILEGIPRTRMQAEFLDQIADIDLVLNFKCSEDRVIRTQVGNGFGIQFQGCLNQPSFSNGAAWRGKFRAYAEQSNPLEDYYREQKKLLDFKVADAPSETWQGLLAALRLQHLSSSPHLDKLSA